MKRLGLVDATMSLYPAWWRDIYGEEMRTVTEDLIAAGRSERQLAANLMRGALSVRLRGTAMPMQRSLWAARTRTSVAVATLSWLAVVPFVLAATGGRTGSLYLSAAAIADPATKVSTYSFEVLQLALLVSFCVVAVGWTSLVRGVRRSSEFREAHVAVLSYVPLLSFLAAFGLFIARQTQLPNAFSAHGTATPVPLDGNPSAAHILLIVLWVVFVTGAFGSVLSLAFVTRRVELPMLLLRSGKRIATFTAFTLALMAALALGGAMAAGFQGHEVPGLGNVFYSGHYSAGQYLVVSPKWALAIVPLTVAAAASLAGLRSARRAWRMTLSLAESA